MARLRFPDGACVETVGIDDRDPENPRRDYGLYFDPAWRPTWPAEVVDWDFRHNVDRVEYFPHLLAGGGAFDVKTQSSRDAGP